MNIVFIQCDSMDGRVMGCMGHPAMENATPNMDKLSKKGVMFKNTYCNNPICCPSRASMFSGEFTHHCEGWNNYKGLEKDTSTFETRLKEKGYITKTFGKTDYLSGYHTVRARVTPWTRSANIMKPTYNMHEPKIIESTDKRVHLKDWQTVDNSINWLDERKESEKPFMLYIGLCSPHPPFTTSRYYYDMIDEDKIDIPPLDKEDHPVMKYQRIQKNWKYGFSDETVKKVRRIYFSMIAEVDAMVGKVISALEQFGLTDSTYIVFTSDHGEMAMEHRQFYKMSLYESSARVPLIICGPDVDKGKSIDNIASLVDIYPTLMDMSNTVHPEGLDGQSLMPELKGETCTRRDWALTEFHGTTCNTGCFMLRQGEWKYNVYVGYRPQLFNLKKDPYEIYNLAEKRKDVVRDMDKKLKSITDYESVDAKVKEYDKKSFEKWREEKMKEGTYQKYMAKVHSGWDGVTFEQSAKWSQEDEDKILKWLK